jgi:hypothetical protein
MAISLTEAKIDFAALGDNVIVPLLSDDQQVLLYRIFFLISGGAAILTFLDGEGGDALTGPLHLADGAAFVLDRDGTHPWFTTSEGNALVLNMSAAVQVSGRAYFHRQKAVA